MCVVADTVQFPKTTVGGWEPTPCVEQSEEGNSDQL